MIRGNTRPVQKRDINLRANIHNRFDIEVLDAATGDVKQRAQALNLICDVFWTKLFHVTSNKWCPDAYIFRSILFGSGSGTPAASDTALFNLLGYRLVGGTNEPAITYSANERTGIFTVQATGTLEASDNVGDTITEVGIGYDTSHCVTHALLQDMNGNPISITKTATDVIKIYATFFVHWSSAGWYGGSVMMRAGFVPASFDNPDTNLQNSLTACMLRAYSSSYSVGLYRKAAARCTGTSQNAVSTEVPFSINAAAKTATASMRYNAADANVPIRALEFSVVRNGNTDQYPTFMQLLLGSWFSPPAISGEADGTGDGSAAGFDTAFPVKTVGTVYVDGVAASGATMRKGPADGTTMQRWFNQLVASDASALTVSGVPLYWVFRTNGKSYIAANGALTIPSFAQGGITRAFENPYADLGISKFMVSSDHTYSRELKAQASDDLTTWTDCGTVTTNGSTAHELAVDAACQKKKYFRFVSMTSGEAETFYIRNAYAAVANPEHNIIFATPPAAGAVITADYTPDCVAKDGNHVFDLNIVLTFGEFVEE